LIVSGKGGVGKTTVSLALGLLAAERGKRTLIAEVNSEEQVAHLLERPPIGYQETELLPGLWGINIQPKKSFEEYVLLQIKFRSLYRAVFENRFVRYFIEATPGLSDLMCIGKIYALVDDYDLVIVDAPSTGHSVALLEVPSIVAGAVRVGPLKTEAEKIDLLLHDPSKTEAVVVTLPEEMPVAEAVEMSRRLEEKLKLPLGPVFLNQVQNNAFTTAEKGELSKLKKERGANDPVWKRIELQIARAELSEEYAARLAEALKKQPVVPIPFIYSTHFGLTEIQSIAATIEKNYGD
jgi:anion-transporting  ArsA/GET3 family ATPase